jgi:hypothetical protein
MTQSKTYKSNIAARFGILLSRIKNKFNGSKLVTESYKLKYNTITREYTVDMNFMTQSESTDLLHIIDTHKTIINNMQPTPAIEDVDIIPTIQKEDIKPAIEDVDSELEYIAKAQKWAADVEKNRQKQLAEKKVKAAKTPVAVETKKAKKTTKDDSVPAIKAKASKKKSL